MNKKVNLFREINAEKKCVILLLHGQFSLPHYFLQFFGKVIVLGKPQPMLLGYEQIIPATIGEAKKLNYDSGVSI